jgi:cadmium resistance protein CadD (predicted permease)
VYTRTRIRYWCVIGITGAAHLVDVDRLAGLLGDRPLVLGVHVLSIGANDKSIKSEDTITRSRRSDHITR